jgi:hypothetical protein
MLFFGSAAASKLGNLLIASIAAPAVQCTHHGRQYYGSRVSLKLPAQAAIEPCMQLDYSCRYAAESSSV